MNQTITPKARINSIDALRGFALIGIMLFHCMERFDLTLIPSVASPFWQTIDSGVFEIVSFLFAGKSYAIFSLLFGLSFFMQMDSQAAKGVDFRWRFVWRLTLLLVLGWINGLVYMGEFFVVYAILGVFLIPLYRVPTKWLIALSVLLFLQIPDIVSFVSLLGGNVPSAPNAPNVFMAQLYSTCADIYVHGSIGEVFDFNLWRGHAAKLLWVFNNSRYLQLIGLFIVGMLIGRYGIHKDEQKMVRYSRAILPYSVVWFAVFYAILSALPYMGVGESALHVGKTLFKMYANLGMMVIYICGLILLYYKSGARRALDRIAPVGRMSVTNYMLQSVVGVVLFYGFGANLAAHCNYLESLLIGLAFCTIQIVYSNWWIKRYYYGPLEWLWRTATWFKRVPLRRVPPGIRN